MPTTEKHLERAAVEKLFAERKDFIVIGLTGRTGSGCTTVANLLTRNFEELQPPCPVMYGDFDERQYQIIYDYLKPTGVSKSTWAPFKLIEMKHVIFSFIVENELDLFVDFIESITKQTVNLDKLSLEYQKLHETRLYYKEYVGNLTSKGENVPGDDEIYNYYFNEIPAFYKKFQEAIPPDCYTKLLQRIGDNIRASGKALCSDISPDNILNLAQRVNMLIKILRRRNINEKKKVLVVIDALRNPFEATFFKDRYSAFYLFSINTTDDERRTRLAKKGLKYADIEDLDKREYPSRNNTIDDFYQINIEKTIEIADVHIDNRNVRTGDFSFTKRQLARYVGLIMHPGLVSPTPIERCMQIAYDAKLNSGCLSRQVGAVISDPEYNTIAVGWNCTPSNQIPCNMRSIFSIIREDMDDKCCMSEFERTNDDYRKFLRRKTQNINFDNLGGRICSYCFKDAYNSFKSQKNQVYTRSIHAEEMAFLHAAKVGSASVRGGYLFTTASPCELCSKKACHTGISKIYYIDQYPGISSEHIINCGNNVPEMLLFHGAIGRAYTQLYAQILPYKDELYMLLNLTFKTKQSASQIRKCKYTLRGHPIH